MWWPPGWVRRAAGQDAEFMRQKIAIARLDAEHLLTKPPGQRDSIVEGAGSMNALDAEAI